MKTPRILLAEDDPNLGSLLQEYLHLKGLQTTLFSDGLQAWEAFLAAEYDLCILDVMMPQLDGFGLAKRIRAHSASQPIIFLTAKSLQEDILEGFRIGADDYLCKPFNMEELLLRIRAVLKRSQSEQAESPPPLSVFRLRGYTFYYDEMRLEYGQQSFKLTSKEAELLRLLCLQRNQVLSRQEALKAIWGDDSYFNARSMDVYITKLRKFFKEDSQISILNIHGSGFKLLVLD